MAGLEVTVEDNEVLLPFQRKLLHRCTQRPTKIYEKLDLSNPTTEYSEKYTHFENIKPVQHQFQASGDKISECLPCAAYKEKVETPDEYKSKMTDPDFATTYKRNFIFYPSKPAETLRPPERHLIKKEKMDTLPTYKDDFRPWTIKKSETAEHLPTKKFQNGLSPQKLRAGSTFKPLNLLFHSSIPFNAVTIHKSSFVPYQLEPKFVRPKEVYKPNNEPFDDLTTNRHTYKGLFGEPAKSCKPTIIRVEKSAPFVENTEFRDNFQEIPLPKVRKLTEDATSTSHIEQNNKIRQDHVSTLMTTGVPKKPVYSRISKFPFQGRSITKEDFKAWDKPCRLEMIKPKNQIPAPSGKFDDLTTFRSHYIPHELIPTLNFKPVPVVIHSTEPFDDSTVYSTQYTAKKQKTCPACYTCPPGYAFENTDSHGHKLFRKDISSGKDFSPSIDKVSK
ncbi:stabilizer of axonemal microtubules 2 isoform X1 [Antechinus flavipes]|uniref:stabilizer of axonemal microtubules 2 isoform X1 n=1 Tax=Antechinus flavipes TaxID=38775 RepID=UPI0022360194|nr:stabilizer of axonemal microtubules 2 isoform X1 [Antechinus flavipes]